jgi:hypothetical protein
LGQTKDQQQITTTAGESLFLRKWGGVSNNNNNSVNSDEKQILKIKYIYEALLLKKVQNL